MNDLGLPFSILLAVVLTGGGCLLLIATRRHQSTLQFQLRLFCIAFVVRFGMSLWIYVGDLISILKDEDSSGWTSGVGLMRKWVIADVGIIGLPGVWLEAFQEHHQGYKYLLGSLFFLTDSPSRMSAAALNCFFGAVTVALTYRVARSLFSEWVAVRAGWLVCFFPSMIVWSAQTVKEPVVILLETLALYCCVRLHVDRFSLKYLLVCAATIILLIPFRFYAAWIAGAAVILTLAFPHLKRRKFSIGTAIALALVIIPLVLTSGALVQQEAEFERFDLQRIQTFKRDVATGGVAAGAGSGAIQNYDLKSPVGLVMALSVGSAHLLLAPFPWQLGSASLRMLLSLPELVAWWYLFTIAIAPGFWYLFRHRLGDIQPLLYFTLGLGFLYSLMFGNVGLIFRQRAQLLPWLLIFAAVGLERRYLKKLLADRRQKSQFRNQMLAEVGN